MKQHKFCRSPIAFRLWFAHCGINLYSYKRIKSKVTCKNCKKATKC